MAVRTARGYIGSLLVQFERRSIQLLALATLCLPLLFVTLPPFRAAPDRTVTPELIATPRPRPQPQRPVALPKPPLGDFQARAVDRLARRGVAIRSGGGTRRWVALTFDDGPGPYTSRLIAELERLQVPATLFQVGKMLQEFPGPAVLAANTALLSIGDHTYSHSALPRLKRRRQLREILDGATLMERLGEPAPRLFRPPYGAWDTDTRDLIKQRGMAMILWNVDSKDYTRPGVDMIVRNVVSAVRPGSIVLMHDGGGNREQTIAAIPKIVRRLRARGYGLVTVDKLISEDPPRRRADFGRPGQPLTPTDG